jgi:hypothetical protein
MWNSATAAIHICLALLAFILILLAASGIPALQGMAKREVGKQDLFPTQLHSVTDCMGHSNLVLHSLHYMHYPCW